MASERDGSRFLGMQFQTEACEPLAQLRQERISLDAMCQRRSYRPSAPRLHRRALACFSIDSTDSIMLALVLFLMQLNPVGRRDVYD